MATIPSALAGWPEIVERASGRELIAFLDFDGTLSPLVDEPDDAALADGMDESLALLASRCTVAVVSGRGADDVAARLGRSDVWIAGSHGFEIVDPSGARHDHPDAGPAAAALDSAARSLSAELADVEGVRVERKHLGLTVHDRMVADAQVARVRAAALAEVARHPELRATHGKRVTELRPDVDWDKGAAVQWLLARLVDGDRPATPVYVGDDTTDEDAFVALGAEGVSIVVVAGGAPDRPSVAEWSVADPAEVRVLLMRLADLATPQERGAHGR